MLMKSKTLSCVYWLVTIASFAAALTMLFTYTPVEKTMGPIQKLFYPHLPSAITAFLGCLVAFIAGVGYLWQRKMAWDDLAAAGALVAALMCTVVLVTGSIWAKVAWGSWWTWTPRLTFSLLLWLLYVVYLAIRPAVDSRRRRAAVSAVYGVVAFLDVPLVYLSVRLMPDLHPVSAEMTAQMKLTLAVWFVPVMLLGFALIKIAYNSNRRRRIQDSEQQSEASWSVDTAADLPKSDPTDSTP